MFSTGKFVGEMVMKQRTRGRKQSHLCVLVRLFSFVGVWLCLLAHVCSLVACASTA